MHRPAHTRVALQATLLGLLTLLLAPVAGARDGYPRIIDMYLSAGADAQQLQDLARYDALILDADFPLETPGGIEQIRQINPDILIYAYVPINGILESSAARPLDSIYRIYWDEVEANDWWLYDTQGNFASDWPGKRTTNLTSHSGTNARGETYGEWFGRFMVEVVWAEGVWDGLFLDDMWDDIAWLNAQIPYPVDSDRNGIGDDPATLDAEWAAGGHASAEHLRELLGPDIPLLGNGGNTAYASMNGAMIENFPYIGPNDGGNPYGYAWKHHMFTSATSYTKGLAGYQRQPVTMILNTHWDGGTHTEPDRSGRFEAHKRLMLGSTLLYDGWFSFDRSFTEHVSLWWEPEYDLYLGAPLGPAEVVSVNGVGVYRRDYEAATIVVNPNNTSIPASQGIPALDGWDAYLGAPLPPVPADVTPPAPVDTYWGWPEDAFSAVLRWRAVGDDSLTGRADHVEIRRSPDKIWTETDWNAATEIPNDNLPAFAGTWEQFTVAGLSPESTYYFMVRAVDDAGNRSGIKNFFRIITPPDSGTGVGDTQPPATPTNPSGSGDVGSVQLTWAPASEPDFHHYNLYRATLPSGVSSLHRTGLTQASHTDTDVLPGATYAYRVTAVDETGNESAPTGEIQVRVPDAPPGTRTPEHFQVSAAWPSPTHGLTSVTVSTGETITVSLDVYDVRGRRLAGEVRQLSGAGDHTLSWDGFTADGRPAGSGVYWILVQSAGERQMRRVTVLR